MRQVARTLQPRYGARFFRDEKGLDMFEHRIDASSCIGPREATKTDKQNHSALWAAYLAEQTEEEDRNIKRGPGRPRKVG
jgi:hypothetical protein